jgi:predicted RNase H-like nuclease (RuvC/YqgF family)
MQNSFDVLEQKVRKAVELVNRLRNEKKTLESDLAAMRSRLLDTEKRFVALEKERAPDADHGKGLEGLEREVKALRTEREEVRGRIARLVEVLDGLE